MPVIAGSAAMKQSSGIDTAPGAGLTMTICQ
jgi:hypothetical protein